MSLFRLFGGKRKDYASSWLQLTVVYATALNGLEPEQAFALRGKIMAANPIGFDFLNGDSFLAFYRGTADGLAVGTQLADTLRTVARDKAVPAFGVAVQQGECLAQLGAGGRFAAKPMGGLISQTKRLAVEQAQCTTS